MRRGWLFAPVGAMALFAGYLGLQLGQPLSETDIITRFAQMYVKEAGAGAAQTDCLAVPSNLADVRLVVVCTYSDGTVFSYPSGPRGQLREMHNLGDAV